MRWDPTQAYLRRSRLRRFLDRHGIDDLPALVRRADAEPAWYWGAIAQELELEWQRAPDAIAGEVAGEVRRWFVGGRYNIAHDAVTRWVRRGRGDERALSWDSEQGERRAWDFATLEHEVARAAAGLRRVGVKCGDRVAIQLPMVPAALVATLACARIGAIVVPLFSGLGRAATLERLWRSEARVHIVASSYSRRGRPVDSLAPALAAHSASGPLGCRLVVVGERPLNARAAGVIDWSSLDGDDDSEAELGAEHPLMLSYTSGTTGAPKGVVLTHAGFAVKAGSDAAWCFDLQPGEVASWSTDPGWVMFPITVIGGLVAGASQAMLDGAVDWPTPARLWRFADEHEVSMLGVSPTLVRTLMAHGEAAVPPRPPPSLRVLASSGEPLTAEAFNWLFERIGATRLPIINYSGGTELSGAILTNTTIQPIRAGGFAGPLPGMGADVVDDTGCTVRGQVGELVLRVHSPGMTRALWDDPRRYQETYWARWPGIWHHGDWAERAHDGTWYIQGRSDDTLKIAGKRVGPAEVESVVNAHPHVAESVAIGVPDRVKGKVLVVLVRLVSGADRAAVAAAVGEHVADSLGKPFRPQRVLAVEALPKTRSGKILRRVVRAAYLGEDLGDISALEQPESVGMIGSAA